MTQAVYTSTRFSWAFRAGCTAFGQEPPGIGPNKQSGTNSTTHLPPSCTSRRPMALLRMSSGRREGHITASIYNGPRVEDGDPMRASHGIIWSMKYTQLWRIKEATAIRYLEELAHKYKPGTRISATPSNPRELWGTELDGKMVLLVPPQEKEGIPQGIPPNVYRRAKQLGIVIAISRLES